MVGTHKRNVQNLLGAHVINNSIRLAKAKGERRKAFTRVLVCFCEAASLPPSIVRLASELSSLHRPK